MNKQEYMTKNSTWLKAKAQEPEVQPLAKGVCYKVLAQGDPSGKQPTMRSIITAHYTGYTIDGKQFDTSVGSSPLAIRLNEVIDGWAITLTKMHVGDKWQVYIPAEQAYGKYSQPGIPAYSTLIFDIELLGVF